MTDETRPDLLHGLQAIADETGLSYDQTHHAVRRGDIPTFRMGRIVCARRSAIAKHFAALEAGEGAR